MVRPQVAPGTWELFSKNILWPGLASQPSLKQDGGGHASQVLSPIDKNILSSHSTPSPTLGAKEQISAQATDPVSQKLAAGFPSILTSEILQWKVLVFQGRLHPS